jgi:hypothetical protein
MKFLRETTEFSQVQVELNEGKEGTKDLYISGIFAEAELKNRNGRIYPKAVMERAINKYVEDYVSKKRAIGELSHPENRPMPKPEFASHLITELRMDGTTVYGKAKVLNTPQGQILRGLLEGGVQMGVSTRALGSLREGKDGTKIVEDDLQLFAIDAVSDPSSINAWVDAINESAEWVITGDGRVFEKTRTEVKKGKITEEKALEMFQKFLIEIQSR